MVAIVKDRDTQQRSGNVRAFPVAQNSRLWAGTIACLNPAGRLTPAVTAPDLKCVGVTRATINNDPGASGAITGEAMLGVFGPFANSSAGDAITLADIGADCFIVDNQTVAKTSASATRSVAGKVFDVDVNGVWVNFVL